MADHDILDTIIEEFKEILKRNLPYDFLRSFGYSGPIFDARVSDDNRNYKSSPYYFEGDPEFIHWTTMDNLISIINNREIRLYNLHNSEDANEFNHAAETLELPESAINFAKKNYYTFSFCKAGDLTNEYLWEHYGKKLSGVAIHFTIENDPVEWKNYMLSNVYYELPQSLKKLNADLQSLKQKYPGMGIRLDLGKLIGFHKEQKFANENEVRLATYFPFKSIEEEWKFAKTEFRVRGLRHQITSYTGLPLWTDDDSPYLRSRHPELDRRGNLGEAYFKSKPLIKIKSIHVGKNCGIPNLEFLPYRAKLFEMIRLSLGYDVEIELNLFSL